MFGFFKKDKYKVMTDLQDTLDSVTDAEIEHIASILREKDENDSELSDECIVSDSAKRAFVAYQKVKAKRHSLAEDLATEATIALLSGDQEGFQNLNKKAMHVLHMLEALADIIQPMFWYEFHRTNKNVNLPASIGVRKGFEIVEYSEPESDDVDVTQTPQPLQISNPANLNVSRDTSKPSGWARPVDTSSEDEK